MNQTMMKTVPNEKKTIEEVCFSDKFWNSVPTKIKPIRANKPEVLAMMPCKKSGFDPSPRIYLVRETNCPRFRLNFIGMKMALRMMIAKLTPKRIVVMMPVSEAAMKRAAKVRQS